MSKLNAQYLSSIYDAYLRARAAGATVSDAWRVRERASAELLRNPSIRNAVAVSR